MRKGEEEEEEEEEEERDGHNLEKTQSEGEKETMPNLRVV